MDGSGKEAGAKDSLDNKEKAEERKDIPESRKNPDPSKKELDYINILKALDDIPFSVGRNLLIDYLQGNASNESIKKNLLNKKKSFGSMAYDKNELSDMIDSLMKNNLIKVTNTPANRFWKVLFLTEKGRNEISNPSLYKRKLAYNFKATTTNITDDDKLAFNAFGEALGNLNNEQKKAVISQNNHILCLAGAGSGKTTVLAKRVEFLCKYNSVNPKRVLAITFTRKARQEMISRISKIEGLEEVSIETFNSFCEKILKRYTDMIYGMPVRVITYRDKITIVNRALSKLGINMNHAINEYFTQIQKRSKTNEQLANIFMNDCFFIRDYFKFKNKRIIPAAFDITNKDHERSAKIVFSVCNYIEDHMSKNGLRDFADQLIDTIAFFEKYPDMIPRFDHILIDEYQDVNSTQIRLVDLLSPPSLFCVGDPRQSIFGWRGSDIRYILNFEEKYPGADIITLTKNYRSTNHIVKLINTSIKNMGLADLEHSREAEKDIKLLKFDSEDSEFEFVAQKILASEIPRSHIFVLARTNRQLNDLSNRMHVKGIKHVVRSDEQRSTVLASGDEVTLATIHAIKGLEAEMVIVIGCNGSNFPCKGSEHPVIDMVKVDEYDKEEEERRLFYVALSRAKSCLYLTYTGKKPTSFINPEMMSIVDEKNVSIRLKDYADDIGYGKPNGSYGKENRSYRKDSGSYRNGNDSFEKGKGSTGSKDSLTRLKDWRRDTSRNLGVPPYMVMHDKTLIDLVQNKPSTMRELEDIHGLGPTKIMKYGEEILRIVNGE